AVATMLGTVDRTRVGALLEALGAGDGERLLAIVAALAEFAPDWGGVLDALADALHRLQVRQLVPNVAAHADDVDLGTLAAALRPELVQLWYQMALTGRRDLPLAPSARAGFEMSLLRMLAFRPADAGAQTTAGPAPTTNRRTDPTVVAQAALQQQAPSPTAGMSTPMPASATVASRDPVATPRDAGPPVAEPAAMPTPDLDAEHWLQLVAGSGLRGPARELAAHAAFVGYAGGVLRLALSQADEHLKAPSLVKLLAEALSSPLGGVPQVRFETAPVAAGETLHQRSSRERDARQSAAEETFLNDPDVQRLIGQHGAKVVPDSIRPFDE
ncbi:MAG: DNA polymerase III subunit gamma/tau, partial [Gammaproteobacteria bacterium]|nr:DNA polymerase III subunit gamma/tau [Gammaproteobacteria bacterium]